MYGLVGFYVKGGVMPQQVEIPAPLTSRDARGRPSGFGCRELYDILELHRVAGIEKAVRFTFEECRAEFGERDWRVHLRTIADRIRTYEDYTSAVVRSQVNKVNGTVTIWYGPRRGS